MWFLFGIITILSFAIGVIIRNLQANWKGNHDRVDENQFSYKIVKNKYGIIGVMIGVEAPKSFNFRLKEEKWYDSIFTNIGLSVETQVGEDNFDKMVYIVSDDSVFLDFLKNSEHTRQSLLKLFNVIAYPVKRIKEVRCSNKKLWIYYKTHGDLEDKDIKSLAKIAVPILDSIKNDLNDIRSNQTTPVKRDPFIFKASALLAVSSGLFVSGVIHFYRLNWENTPFLVYFSDPLPLTLAISSSILLFLLILTVVLLGRSSRTHLVFIELILIGGIGLAANSYSVLRDVNMEYDTSNEITFPKRVISKHISRSKNSTSYYIKVVDWLDQTKTKSITIDQSMYNDLYSGSQIEISQKEGYLGYKWITNIDKI